MECQKIEDGEIITEPGYYDIPIEWYHQQCCDGPSISSSGIRQIIFGSPADFYKTSPLNPNRADDKDTNAFALGRAAHHLALGEPEFNKHFIIRPELGPDGEKWNSNKTICKEQLQEWADAKRTVLTGADVDKVLGMAGLLPWQKGMTNCGLANTPLVAEGGALAGEIERSLVFKIGDIWVKSRPDAIPGSSNDFTDLKTHSSRSPTGGMSNKVLSRVVYDYGYFVQGAVVGMGAKYVLGREMEGFHLIFVDTGNVHAVSIKTLEGQDLMRGERTVFAALHIFEKCLETGIWPGPTASQSDAQILPLPSWGREEFDKNMDYLETEYGI